LFAKAFELLTITPILTDERLRKAVMVLSKASIELCKGQTEDVTSFKREFDESYYYSLINKKTSSLLAASSSIGCIAGGGNDEDLRVAEAYGRKLGLAFQLVDDLLGIVGDPNVTGKPVGGDLREGKKTIPIYFALKRASPSEKEVIMRIYGRKEASQEEVERAVNIIKGLGVEDDVRKMADRYAKDALAQLDLLPKGPGRKWLIELVDFVVKRAH
jgi:geranylgeranyl diphosphate synthase type I